MIFFKKKSQIGILLELEYKINESFKNYTC